MGAARRGARGVVRGAGRRHGRRHERPSRAIILSADSGPQVPEAYWAGKGKPEQYASGTWGPESADKMMARDGRSWRRP